MPGNSPGNPGGGGGPGGFSSTSALSTTVPAQKSQLYCGLIPKLHIQLDSFSTFLYTPSQVEQTINLSPTHLWLFNEYEGDILDHAGTNDLATTTAVGVDGFTYPRYKLFRNADKWSVAYRSTSKHEARNSTIMDVDGTDSFTLIGCSKITHENNGDVVGKNDEVNPGWRLRTNAFLDLRFTCFDGVNTRNVNLQTANTIVDTGLFHYWGITLDRVAGQVVIARATHRQQQGLAGLGSLSNVRNFAIGHYSGILQSALSQHAWMAYFDVGTAATLQQKLQILESIR